MRDFSRLAVLPEWLHVQIDPEIPERWHVIARLCAAAAQQVIGDDRPRRALLRLRKASEDMELKFFVAPRLRPETSIAVQHLVELVSQLANALRRQELADNPPVAAQTIEDLLREQTDASDAHTGHALDAELPGDVPKVKVFTWDESLLAGGADRGRDGDGAARIGRTLKRLQRAGTLRPLCTPPATWPQMVDHLAEAFPNFAQVVAGAIRPHVALTSRGIRHRLPPLLLVGPPGIGKTLFAQRLAQLLNVPPPLMISIAGETNGSAVGGSSTFWSNSSPGKIFEYLAWGERGGPAVANGLVVLDELDKVATDSRYDPLGALYTLLEANTAREFQDQSLPDVTIDASHLRVVCTANQLDAIPAPLRSRMALFQIEPPSPAQARHIVRSMYRSLVGQLGVSLDGELAPEIVDQAARLEPRRAKLLLEAAIASAVSGDRTRVEISDWRAVQYAGTSGRPTMGFIDQR